MNPFVSFTAGDDLLPRQIAVLLSSEGLQSAQEPKPRFPGVRFIQSLPGAFGWNWGWRLHQCLLDHGWVATLRTVGILGGGTGWSVFFLPCPMRLGANRGSSGYVASRHWMVTSLKGYSSSNLLRASYLLAFSRDSNPFPPDQTRMLFQCATPPAAGKTGWLKWFWILGCGSGEDKKHTPFFHLLFPRH